VWAVSEAQDLAEVGKRLRAQVKTLAIFAVVTAPPS
jgi:hypothetical protein